MDLHFIKRILLLVMALAVFTLPIRGGLGYTNLFVNADFEDWSDSSTLGSGWDQHNLYAGDTLARVDTGAAPSMVHNGTYSVQCALNGSDIAHSNLYQFYTPLLGVQYTYSLWVLENNPQGSIALKATEFGEPSIVYYSDDSVDSTSYQQISVTFIGTGNSFYFTIYLKNDYDPGNTIWMYFDEAVLIEGTLQDISEGNYLFLLPTIAIFGFIIVRKRK